MTDDARQKIFVPTTGFTISGVFVFLCTNRLSSSDGNLYKFVYQPGHHDEILRIFDEIFCCFYVYRGEFMTCKSEFNAKQYLFLMENVE